MGEAGIDFVMAMIELNRPEFVPVGMTLYTSVIFVAFPALGFLQLRLRTKPWVLAMSPMNWTVSSTV